MTHRAKNKKKKNAVYLIIITDLEAQTCGCLASRSARLLVRGQRRVSKSVSVLYVFLVLDLLDVIRIVVGWLFSLLSMIRVLRLFVTDGFSDCLKVCSSTQDICRRRIFAGCSPVTHIQRGITTLRQLQEKTDR